MITIFVELFVIFFLITVNGVLAMAEIALVSARKTRLEQQAARGNHNARIALKLASAPGNYLATIQIGITLIGILAGAFGGATLAKAIEAGVQQVSFLAPHSQIISLILVVVGITYLSLVFGELVPKRAALYNPEKTTLRVAPGMQVLSRVTAPLSNLLNRSTDLVLKLIGSPTSAELSVTEEDIKALVQQGAQAGVVADLEQQMVSGVFRLGDRRAEELFTPRTEVEWLDTNRPLAELGRVVISSSHSVFPAALGSLDNIVGVISAKELLARMFANPENKLRPEDLQEPFVVPESAPALEIVQSLRECDHNMVLVIDEHGGISGLLTPRNILNSIYGDMITVNSQPKSTEAPSKVDSWLINGLTPVDELKEALKIDVMPPEAGKDYKTLGGMIATHLGRIPDRGAHLNYGGWRFEVVAMDGHRVETVRITKTE